MILYVNSCVRSVSRTDRIARALLQKLGGEYTELRLWQEDIRPLDEAALDRRESNIRRGNFDCDMFRYARQFADADTIVIGAPLWDGSFPSLLKVYLENIYVIGIVSKYGADGKPCGMCKAKDLYFVSTAGGRFLPDFGFNCVKMLATDVFGIRDVHLIRAEMLDVDGFDAEQIVQDTISRL